MTQFLKRKPFIIAEIGQSHHGNFNKLKNIIKLVGSSDVDAIKLQTHFSEHESTYDEPFRNKKNINKKFKTRKDYWKSVEFSDTQWLKISKLVNKQKKIFLSSPFSLKGLNCLLKTNMPAIKIGSGEFFSKDLLQASIKSKLPLIVSTGLSNQVEISKMIKLLKKNKCKFTILQCETSYPTDFKKIGLNYIKCWKKKFKCNVGISIHSSSISPAIASITEGADIIEVHVKTFEDKFNPDNSSSISIKQLNNLCNFRNDYLKFNFKKPKNKKLDKKQLKLKKIFTKSICLKQDRSRNYIIKKSDIVYKKPGYGLKYEHEKFIIGKRLLNKVSSNRILTLKDLKI